MFLVWGKWEWFGEWFGEGDEGGGLREGRRTFGTSGTFVAYYGGG